MSRECRHISGAVHFSGGLRLGRGLRCWSGCRGYFHKRTRSTRRLRSHVEVRLSFVKEIFTLWPPAGIATSATVPRPAGGADRAGEPLYPVDPDDHPGCTPTPAPRARTATARAAGAVKEREAAAVLEISSALPPPAFRSEKTRPEDDGSDIVSASKLAAEARAGATASVRATSPSSAHAQRPSDGPVSRGLRGPRRGCRRRVISSGRSMRGTISAWTGRSLKFVR